MADTIEVIGAVGGAAATLATAIIAAYQRGHRNGTRRRASEPELKNGSLVSAAADMLEGSTDALVHERQAREAALREVYELTKRCAKQDAEIERQAAEIASLQKSLREQDHIIAGMRITIENLEKSIQRLERQ